MNAADLWKRWVPRARRREVVRQRVALRSRVPLDRVLPDTLIIGAQRAGTSSLYKYLGQHPDAVPSLRKETEYFTMHYGEGEQWYRAHFPTRAGLRVRAAAGRPDPRVFEATPYYLFHPHAPARAAVLTPGARLIALLRDPVERAYSHWQHEVRGGRENLSFEEALDREDERVRPEHERLLAEPSYRSNRHHRYSYVARGRYAEQLERWLTHFRREQLLVLRSEALYLDPADTFGRILEHLGLRSWEPREFRNHSYVIGRPPAGPPMASATRARLEAVFASEEERLTLLLGEPVGWS